MFQFLINNAVFLPPARVVTPQSWAEHIPFAMALVGCHKPSVLVELGTHTGMSYCAFCQGVAHHRLPTKCYAVDTWKGDEHSGAYGDEVWRELDAYNGSHYGEFSSLLRMTFDEALDYFSDGTIDLLHIDGCHTYQAVKHDFESWLPRMSEKGLVLIHDTAVREKGFGAWRFLEEVKEQYPSFEFQHGHGLAVLGVGKSIPETEMGPLFRLPEKDAVFLRSFFYHVSQQAILRFQMKVELDRHLCESAQLCQQIQSLLNSRTWRWTWPIRRAWELAATRLQRVRGAIGLR